MCCNFIIQNQSVYINFGRLWSRLCSLDVKEAEHSRGGWFYTAATKLTGFHTLVSARSQSYIILYVAHSGIKRVMMLLSHRLLPTLKLHLPCVQ